MISLSLPINGRSSDPSNKGPLIEMIVWPLAWSLQQTVRHLLVWNLFQGEKKSKHVNMQGDNRLVLCAIIQQLASRYLALS